MIVTVPLWLVQAYVLAVLVIVAAGIWWLAAEIAWKAGVSGLAFTQLLGDYIAFRRERYRKGKLRQQGGEEGTA